MEFQNFIGEGVLALIVGFLVKVALKKWSSLDMKLEKYESLNARRDERLRGLLTERTEEIKSEMNGLVKEETCQERKASCDRLHQEAYFGPVTQALGEIAETVKRDREEFWKAINGHSHEGLDPTSRVIRK